ncbi:hypothetical protein [Streptobacillus canis]|uniref:hypothetical protein n=1 Tax=Streptobacillus canis TaxID=2678686 RepID=UPI0012E20425|nr:hypothetical protein [Streptobacillus canis]
MSNVARRITFDFFEYEQMKIDLVFFNKTKKGLLNELICATNNKEVKKLLDSKIPEIKKLEIKFKKKVINKNSTKVIDLLCDEKTVEVLKKYGINDYSEQNAFIKKIKTNFYKLPRFEREKILYFENYKKLLKVIEGENTPKIVEIQHLIFDEKTNKTKIVSNTIKPIAIKVGLNENRNYLVYVDKNNYFRNIKLSSILNINDTLEEEIFNFKSIDYRKKEKILENFDAYLNILVDEPLEVSFTKKGLYLYENLILVDKPEEIKKESTKKIKKFQCGHFLAFRYFQKFFEDATILGPEHIRKHFIEKIINTAKNYDLLFIDKNNDYYNKIKAMCDKKDKIKK